jgi:hypothetical protein
VPCLRRMARRAVRSSGQASRLGRWPGKSAVNHNRAHPDTSLPGPGDGEGAAKRIAYTQAGLTGWQSGARAVPVARFPSREGIRIISWLRRFRRCSSMTSTAARRPEPSGSASTARNTKSTSAPRTATSSARPWSSTSGTGGGPAARPGALPGAGAQVTLSIPPRSASGPRGRASRSRTAAASRPASSSSTRRPQGHKPL